MRKFTLWLPSNSCAIEQQSGDHFAHHLFMRCLYHAHHDPALQFDVKVVNINKKSDEFKQTGLCRVPSIHTDDDETFETDDDILDYLESFEPRRVDDEEAEQSTSDLLIKFAWFLKDVEHSDNALNAEFYRLEKFLEKNGDKRFLVSDEIAHIDCLVLTRLHTIRIAGKALKQYTIPSQLQRVLQYLQNGYNDELFRSSCPSDQSIVLHWSERKDAPSLDLKQKAKLLREKPTYSMEIV